MMYAELWVKLVGKRLNPSIVWRKSMGLMIPIVPYVLSRNRSRSRETMRFALPARAQARI